MRLRTSKALKYFAILLFSFEMLAPAVLTDEVSPGNELRRDASIVNHTNHLGNLISSLLFEETSSEEEKATRDHKPVFLFSDFDFVQTFVQLTETPLSISTFVDVTGQTDSQPALFTLFHSYLI